jgi:hypothetical protein
VANPEAYGKEFAPNAQAIIKGVCADKRSRRSISQADHLTRRDTAQAHHRPAVGEHGRIKAWYNGKDYQEALAIGKKYATFRRYAVEGQ